VSESQRALAAQRETWLTGRTGWFLLPAIVANALGNFTVMGSSSNSGPAF